MNVRRKLVLGTVVELMPRTVSIVKWLRMSDEEFLYSIALAVD